MTSGSDPPYRAGIWQLLYCLSWTYKTLSRICTCLLVLEGIFRHWVEPTGNLLLVCSIIHPREMLFISPFTKFRGIPPISFCSYCSTVLWRVDLLYYIIFKQGNVGSLHTWLYMKLSLELSSLLLHWFPAFFLSLSYLLSDCKDHLYQQLDKNRLLSNELRVALNED